MKNKQCFKKSTLAFAVALAVCGQQAYACSSEEPLNLLVNASADDPGDGLLSLREALLQLSQNRSGENRLDCEFPDLITISSSLAGEGLSQTENYFIPGNQYVRITTENDVQVGVSFGNGAILGVAEDGKAEFENLSFDGGQIKRNSPLIDLDNTKSVVFRNVEVHGYRGPVGLLQNTALGAIWAASGQEVRIENSRFYDNISNKGGAISATSTSLTIVDSVFEGNQAGGGEGTVAQGGAVYFHGNNKKLTIKNSVFEGNKVKHVSAPADGGAVFVDGNNPEIEIIGSRFNTNEADAGGFTTKGGALSVLATTPTLSIEKTQFVGNTSKVFGGAVYLFRDECVVTIRDSAFYANSAGQKGGAFYSGLCSVDIGQSTFAENTAFQGGGIFHSGNTKLVQTTITNNTAEDTGAALFGESLPESALECSHSVIADNHLPIGHDDAAYIRAAFTVTEDHCYIGDDAMLASAADFTYAPQPGSPLIDAGDPAYQPISNNDQRGDKRVRNGVIDIGAVETGNQAPQRTISTTPIIELKPGLNEFDVTEELGISDDDNILNYSLQTVGSGISVSANGILSIDTSIVDSIGYAVTLGEDKTIELQLDDGFHFQEIAILLRAIDTDDDGIADHVDEDLDGDGVNNSEDAFPYDKTESVDSDGDGVGDNADAFPNDKSETKDTDGDGVGDNSDAFPNDKAETKDSDGDGVGDNADAFPNDPYETTDSDGDGVGNNADAFPTDATRTASSDADGDTAAQDSTTESSDSAEDDDSAKGSGGFFGSTSWFGLSLLGLMALFRSRQTQTRK